MLFERTAISKKPIQLAKEELAKLRLGLLLLLPGAVGLLGLMVTWTRRR